MSEIFIVTSIHTGYLILTTTSNYISCLDLVSLTAAILGGFNYRYLFITNMDYSSISLNYINLKELY